MVPPTKFLRKDKTKLSLECDLRHGFGRTMSDYYLSLDLVWLGYNVGC